MISYSHWGMFDHVPQIVMMPEGFKLSKRDIDELRQPGQIIIMRKSDYIAPDGDCA